MSNVGPEPVKALLQNSACKDFTLHYIETARGTVLSARKPVPRPLAEVARALHLLAVFRFAPIEVSLPMTSRRLSLLVVEDERPLARLWASVPTAA